MYYVDPQVNQHNTLRIKACVDNYFLEYVVKAFIYGFHRLKFTIKNISKVNTYMVNFEYFKRH